MRWWGVVVVEGMLCYLLNKFAEKKSHDGRAVAAVCHLYLFGWSSLLLARLHWLVPRENRQWRFPNILRTSLAFAAKPASTMSILPSSPSGMTSSESPFYKVRYYERLQNVIARLHDTSHELCAVILAAEEHPQLLAFY